jgi:hypothetical protein
MRSDVQSTRGSRSEVRLGCGGPSHSQSLSSTGSREYFGILSGCLRGGHRQERSNVWVERDGTRGLSTAPSFARRWQARRRAAQQELQCASVPCRAFSSWRRAAAGKRAARARAAPHERPRRGQRMPQQGTRAAILTKVVLSSKHAALGDPFERLLLYRKRSDGKSEGGIAKIQTQEDCDSFYFDVIFACSDLLAALLRPVLLLRGARRPSRVPQFRRAGP